MNLSDIKLIDSSSEDLPQRPNSGQTEPRDVSDPETFNRLVALLYQDLRRIARSQLRKLRPGQTIDTTSLVNEVYLKMSGTDPQFVDRGHFLATSAQAMRHILINCARHYLAQKRGGGQRPHTLDEREIVRETEHCEKVLAVGEALQRLAEIEPRMSAVVECRFYAGMSESETATAVGVSERTARRDWMRARAWLKRELMDSASTA